MRARHGRHTTAFAAIWIAALVATLGFSMTLGTGTARGEGEESFPAPSATEPEMSDDPVQCSGTGVGGFLEPGARSISGHVTDGANDVADLVVRLEREPEGYAETTTTASGEFSFPDIDDGTYSLSFYDQTATYVSGYYDGPSISPTRDDATPIVLAGSDATGIEVVLPAETFSQMEGTVTDADGAPVAGALVTARGIHFGGLFGCAATDSNGHYTITGLRSGAYGVSATFGSLPEATYGSAVVVPPAATGIDLQFPAVYSLSGFVLDDGVTPVADIQLTACETSGATCGFGSSDATGAFEITGLVAGDYRVIIQDPNTLFRTGYYGGDGVFATEEADAAILTIPGAGPIEIDLDPAPQINGTIVDETLAGVGDVLVVACDDDIGYCWQSPPSASNGDYAVGVPNAGDYRIYVYDPLDRYPSFGYIQPDGSILPDHDSALVVPAGVGTVTGVDGVLPFGGRIEGLLTAQGTPVAFDYVEFCRTAFACGDGANTDDSGLFASGLLFPGTYYVKGHDPSFTFQYWHVDGGVASPSFGDATPVVIIGGATATIAMDLPPFGADTPAGGEDEPVTISLPDPSGNPPVTMTFDDVTVGGTTSVTVSDVGDPVPSGFQTGQPAVYWDITTTAEWEGNIRVCFSYAGVSFIDPANVHLFHFDAVDGWEDITDPPVDTDNQVVCGITDSLSPFVLAEPVMTFSGFFQPVDNGVLNKVKAGAGVPVKFTLRGDFGLDIFTGGTPSVSVISCTSSGVDAIEQTVAAGDSHLAYDAATGTYVYVFKTSKSWAGSCRRLTLAFTDGTVRTADFTFTK